MRQLSRPSFVGPPQRGLVILTIVLSSLLGPSLVVRAANPFVDPNTGADTTMCGATLTPCRTIAYTIANIAHDGDTIYLAAATFSEHDITIGHSVTIIGQGIGASFIDGGAAGRVIHVPAGVAAKISLTTIQNGIPDPSSFGAGIYNEGTLTLSGSKVSGNNNPISPATVDGGGINNHGMLTIEGSVVSNNIAHDLGGGIFTSGGTVTVKGSSITGNVSGHGGGGLQSNGDHVTVSKSTLDGNSGDQGGGILNNVGGVLFVTDSTVSNNSASDRGGGIANYNTSQATLTGVTVSGSTAGTAGGGIYNTSNAQTTVTNSTISGNSAPNGGGIADDFSGTLTSINTTVAGNSTGIMQTGAGTTLRNTLLANTGANCIGAIATGGYNLSSDTTCITLSAAAHDLTGVNPRLGALADNGGPTQTHALLAASPAIDRIPSVGGCQAGVAADQRGVARPQPVGGSCDIGAYEYVPPSLIPGLRPSGQTSGLPPQPQPQPRPTVVSALLSPDPIPAPRP
ncbi:MAG: choice-of-anchor Q domain-containing protein [Thermomicrobiales bacterium]